MNALKQRLNNFFNKIMNKLGLSMRTKLIVIFVTVKVVPLIIVVSIALHQIGVLGTVLHEIAVEDSTAALNASAVENIERLTTDTAKYVADFLYDRDDDILLLATMEPTEQNYKNFSDTHLSKIITAGEWVIAEDGKSWVPVEDSTDTNPDEGKSTNTENNDMDGYNYRYPENFSYDMIPLYDEITYVDLAGNEIIKYVASGTNKINHKMDPELKNISDTKNTYIKSEDYFSKLSKMEPGEIYVSDVIGSYVGTNYIGMYTPDIVQAAAEERGYDIEYNAEEQAYSAAENPVGERFEGIVRWATPVTDSNGKKIGYVTFALNHDHIMEFVDHITPMNERYTELPSAYLGNYAFIWDYKCRSICHPRHHSIVGYNSETGDPEIPWLETSIYEGWQESGLQNWFDYTKDIETFDNQSRSKTPAPILTQQGYVGLDGRYLNNAPQCTGWMDLTKDGGSGSFYILWSGLYKLTTAGAIPYYTGQYEPSESNDYSKRGFGIVTIGAGLEDFTRPSEEMAGKIDIAIDENLSDSTSQLFATAIIAIIIVVIIAIWIASSLTNNITRLIKGISRFRVGERQFRFNDPLNDEFGTLADSFDDMADSIDDSVKNPLTITDMDKNIIYMNDKALALYGIPLEKVVGQSYTDFSYYPPNTEYCPISALEEGTEAEPFFISELNMYIKGKADYLLNKIGRRIGYIVESMDITEMITRQNQIEQQRSMLNIIFDNSPDLIWYEDTNRILITANPRFASVSGIPLENLIGNHINHSLPHDLIKSAEENDLATLKNSRPLYTEEKVSFADGSEEILDMVRTPIFDTSKKLIGLLGFGRNVTTRYTIESELRKTQIDLEKAVGEANDANQHKGDFLARMSHEIRTPMNAIVGLTNIILQSLDNRPDKDFYEVRDNVEKIESSSQHLMGLLNDILDLSKIDAGKIQLSYEPTDLDKLGATVVSMIQPRCDEKNITFDIHIDDLSASAYMTDSLRLRQVLINLLGNAVKFTPELGIIRLTISEMEQTEEKIKIHFSVRDTGIGISEESQAHIFEAFEQENSKITKKYGGTGLGLAISQKIVELLGGKIKLSSVLGEGSDFYFDLWFDKTDPVQSDYKESTDRTDAFKGKRLLLVDDIEINRMIVKSMLETTGIDIEEASDGIEAVDIFSKSEQGYYDLILMDVQMPNMDGHEASLKIRDLDREDSKTIPIIALTANAFKEDMDRALENGMNSHIAKPIEMDIMFEVLWKYLNENI